MEWGDPSVISLVTGESATLVWLLVMLYLLNRPGDPMPLYEQKCPKCGHTFDVLVPFSEASQDVPCPACEAPRTRRVFSRTNFALKGGGWAKDGYQKDGK